MLLSYNYLHELHGIISGKYIFIIKEGKFLLILDTWLRWYKCTIGSILIYAYVGWTCHNILLSCHFDNLARLPLPPRPARPTRRPPRACLAAPTVSATTSPSLDSSSLRLLPLAPCSNVTMAPTESQCGPVRREQQSKQANLLICSFWILKILIKNYCWFHKISILILPHANLLVLLGTSTVGFRRMNSS
jgi:hypothetical protein